MINHHWKVLLAIARARAPLIYFSLARIAALEYFATVNPNFKPTQPMSELTTKRCPSSLLSTAVQRGEIVGESLVQSYHSIGIEYARR